MTLLQVQIDETLKAAISKRAKRYGVPSSSLVKIALTEAFIPEDKVFGNVFNADRDNAGEGISGKEFLKMLQS